jgi:hypothetical protein
MLDIREGTGGSPSATGGSVPLRWPAPGLEAIHGAAWPPITLLAIGSALLAASVLAAVATPQPFWSTGPFGSNWWAPLAVALLGLTLVLRAMERLSRLLLAGANAARQGYGWDVIGWTAADQTRDAGFLLLGLRHYASLGERERRWMLNARVFAAATYTVALLWVPLSLSAGFVAAGRGIIGGTAPLVSLVLVPAAVLLAVGLCCRLLEGMATGRAWKAWLRRGAAEDQVLSEAAAWRASLDERLATSPLMHPTSPVAPRSAPARALGWTMAALTLLLPLPLITVAAASAVGPALSHWGPIGHGSTATRLARVAVLQPYALTEDPAVTPQQAGEAMNTLMFVGTAGVPKNQFQREPARLHATPFLPSDAPSTLTPTPERIRELFGRLGSLTGEEVQWLERASSHPALDEVRVLARAGSADIGGARWYEEKARAASFYDLPTARTAVLRAAAAAHIGGAVLHASRGELAAAELRLREVVSMGLLLSRDGPTTIDGLIGNIVAEQGGAALEAFYEVTGRQRQAEAMRLAREGVDALDQATRALRTPRWEYEPRDLMASVENELLPRGMRWERLMNLQLVAGCLNPHSAVFGAGAEHSQWLARARESLVRYPSDEALFAAAMNGYSSEGRRGQAVRRLVGFTLREGAGTGSCASVMGAIASLD